MTEQLPFKIKYAVLDPKIIFNECGPMSAGPRGWAPQNIEARKAASAKWIMTMNRKNGFYDRLEESILREGFRNPILVVAGWCRENKLKNLPVEMQADHQKILWCGTNGGSRLWVAEKHNLPVPCIISDFINRFPDIPEVTISEPENPEDPPITMEEELHKYYKDEPQGISINMYGVAIKNLPQSHLED